MQTQNKYVGIAASTYNTLIILDLKSAYKN